MTNENLQTAHENITAIVQQWASGLVTDKELCDQLAHASDLFERKGKKLVGLIDPNTGLRYFNNTKPDYSPGKLAQA